MTSNFKNSIYSRSFLCEEEAKIEQRTSSKKKLFEIGEEAIWESRLTSFFRWVHARTTFLSLLDRALSCHDELLRLLVYTSQPSTSANAFSNNLQEHVISRGDIEQKNHVNRKSHIASSPTSQSSFFEEVCCLLLTFSQQKLRTYIEFASNLCRIFKIWCHIKKNYKIQIRLKFKGLDWFSQNFVSNIT